MGKPWRMFTVMVVNERAPGARSGGSVPGAVHARCVCGHRTSQLWTKEIGDRLTGVPPISGSETPATSRCSPQSFAPHSTFHVFGSFGGSPHSHLPVCQL
jgi:hypothetical protein